jgi:geranyl-CoA carboxylase alpha subunit
MTSKTFDKILIANRGEIAVRVMRTARSLGYKTVAVFSEADRYAAHVAFADEAVLIGAAAVGESYLCADKVLQAAKQSGAQAVHPGYGFLSENCDFANACEQAGIEFIGPPSPAIELMGSKRLSKIAMIEAGVPCIMGYEGADQSMETLVAEAHKIGFPIMVKASAGGGGRGMRLVHEASELEAQIKTARSEAENAFGSGELILEKAVIKPRHIEIQVFADKHGNAVYLGERDCSIQRRHQKVVEEAPSPFVDPELRAKMGEAAVQAAKACKYVGAGTVEFLVDADKNFYFLEMNTRLQVEHPVTELVTGTDLVAWQIRTAAGEALPLTQDQIQLKGHAMEVRLYAEDPANQFLPQTGPVHRWQPATGDGVRIDAALIEGDHKRQVVSPYYDPMLAKIIAYGANREEARRRLKQAVENTVLFGVNTNSEFLGEVLGHSSFIGGQATTAFIAEDFGDNPTLHPSPVSLLEKALACIVSYSKQSSVKQASTHSHSALSLGLSGWSNTGHAPWPYKLKSGDEHWQLSLKESKTHDQQVCFDINHADETVKLRDVSVNEAQIRFEFDGVYRRCEYQLVGKHIFIKLAGAYSEFEDVTHLSASAKEAAGSGQITASMDGAIIEVFVENGATVSKGQTLVILEAMKMEHPLKSDIDGTVSVINVKKGDQVKLRQLLIQVTTEDTTPEAEHA